MASRGRTVVVGSAPHGLAAAAALVRRGEQVVLVEEHELGGTWQSTLLAPGLWVDRGARIPAALGGWAGGSGGEWIHHASLRAGNVFQGALDARSVAPDLGRLPAAWRRLATEELLERAGGGVPGSDPATAEEDLLGRFGPVVTDEVFRPLLLKLLGRDLRELAPGAHRLFLPAVGGVCGVVALGTPELREVWYPTAGGARRWIAAVVHELEAHGVQVLVGVPASEVDADTVVRTATGTTGPVAGPARRLVLHHLVFDRPLVTDLHTVTVLDGDLRSFRVTQYPNLLGEPTRGPWALTVEVLDEDGADPVAPAPGLDAVDHIVDELHLMGLIAPRARLELAGIEVAPDRLAIPLAGHPSQDVEPCAGPVGFRPLDEVAQAERAADDQVGHPVAVSA